MLALRRWLARPVDAASFDLFVRGFGLLVAVAAARFVAHGWVEQFLVAPGFHFRWIPGLPVPGRAGSYALFAVQALAGLGLASGRRTRLFAAVWAAAFVYVDLLEKSLYLNHHVLLLLLGLTVAAVPRRDGVVPAWALALLRLEVGSVWFWAGVAKVNEDWLLRAEPLRTWLSALGDLPVVGPWLGWPPTAYAMSWGGTVYDLSLPFLLSFRRTRGFAVVWLVVFHTTVGLLFPIGVFPWLMVLAATLFFEPSWPRRGPGPALPERPPLSAPATLVVGSVAAALTVFPARGWSWGPDTSWHERGHRFAWRVLISEKTGLVDFRVVERGTGRVWRVRPAEELIPVQQEQLRTQPDLLRDYALHLRERHAAEGRDVAVYADVFASVNGRPAARLLRSDLDLTLDLGALESAGWILAPPSGDGRTPP